MSPKPTRIFYNWMLDLADALALEVSAALETAQPNNITIKESQMAPDVAKPEDKNTNDNSHHSNTALAEEARLNGRDIGPREIDRILALEHPDPHAFLGAHQMGSGTIVRAYRPNADAITVVFDDGTRVPMTRCHEAGIFEAPIDRPDILSYRLEIQYPEGHSYTILDPYSYLPTIGDLDLYLWAESKHERVYDKLGAHLREMRGASGVSFAVWAPNARGVSVIGDFNGWDGRLHMMRTLGSSGVWEIFVPEVGEGTKYKFEIRTRDGDLLLKSDPFATLMEVPPATASVVCRPRYEFRDREWMDARAARDILKTPVSIYEVHLGSWRRKPDENIARSPIANSRASSAITSRTWASPISS